jgi:hypothetical protein
MCTHTDHDTDHAGNAGHGGDDARTADAERRLRRFAVALAAVVAEARAYCDAHPADCDCDCCACHDWRRSAGAVAWTAERVANDIIGIMRPGAEAKAVTDVALGAGKLPEDLSYGYGGPDCGPDGGALELARIPLALAEQLEAAGGRREFIVWPQPKVYDTDGRGTAYRCRSADAHERSVYFRGPVPKFDGSAPLLVEGTLAVDEYGPCAIQWGTVEIVVEDAVAIPGAEQVRRINVLLADLHARNNARDAARDDARGADAPTIR